MKRKVSVNTQKDLLMLSLQVRQERIQKEAKHFTKYNRKRGLRSVPFKILEGTSASRKHVYDLNKSNHCSVIIDERIGFTKEGVFVHQYIATVAFKNGTIKNSPQFSEVRLVDSFGNMRFKEAVGRIKRFIKQSKDFGKIYKNG